MSYFEITLGILSAQAVVIGFVDDPLANKMLEWLFYVSAAMCTVRLMWAALRIAIGRSGAEGSDG